MDTRCGRTALSVQVLVMKVYNTENESVRTQLYKMEERIVLPLDLRLIKNLASLPNVQVQNIVFDLLRDEFNLWLGITA